MDEEAQRLVSAANKAGISGKCNVCGQKDWRPIGYVVGLVLEGATPTENIHRALGVACGKCGLIRLHSAEVLEQYLDG